MSSRQNKEFNCHLFSDGGAEAANGKAGSAFVLRFADKEILVAVSLGKATNNEAEITGCVSGLMLIKLLGRKVSLEKIKFVSDSQYLIKGISEYIHNWQRNGWKTADRKPVKNQGLWQAYLKLQTGLTIDGEHVYGHTGHLENESCDEAIGWVKRNVESFLEKGDGGYEIQTSLGLRKWAVFDFSEAMDKLRALEIEEGLKIMQKKLSRIKLA
ncbi:MAG: ribonuclease HI [Proteobacteria bacterium]|nr:ribonuclease HI [Pseudomonadota bacterium]